MSAKSIDVVMFTKNSNRWYFKRVVQESIVRIMTNLLFIK